MSYDHMEQITERKGEKVALFLTIENATGIIICAMPIYIATSSLPFGVRMPIWLLPTQTRLEAVLRTWRTAWPQGKWLLTTDAWLQGDRWIEYDNGRISERGLFHKTPAPPSAAAIH